MTTATQMLETVSTDGFFLVEKVIEQDTIDSLLEGFESAKSSAHARSHSGETYALRNILHAVPQVLDVAESDAILFLIRSVIGEKAKPVKAILFDKTANVNWNLRWHQDSVISVKERRDVPGFTGWSTKVGIPHVRPAVDVLEQMLAARIHIDDCSADNGALKVIPQSHAQGRLSAEQIEEWAKKRHHVCGANKGDVLLMKPLLLHSSEKALNPMHRRVLHIEYAAFDLPGGLEWGV